MSPRWTKRLALMLLVAGASAAVALPLRADDPWRRTANGWEKMEQWRPHSRFAATASAAASGPRWDLHPAALAWVETVSVLLAMLAFPRPRQSPAWLQEDWRSVLRRSFRASVFGS